MPKIIKVAFGSVPKDGGTFTFYRNLRPGLQDHGVDVRCVSVGKEQADLWEDAYVDDGCVLLAADTRNVKKQAMVFAEWCESEGIDIVMGVNSEAILSALPHLPEKIRVIARCANAFDHGYRITLSCRERLACIIATTPRLENDLVNLYGADTEKIKLISNGIDPEPFEAAAASVRGEESVLRLGFLGRLEHNQKGVFYIPEIVKELNRLNVPFQLRIAGKGKHRSVIERKMRQEVNSGQIEFLGAIPPKEIPSFLAEIDLFLFTSHFEGCPNALLEALMSGCVPVSWMIEGITDFIIDDGKTGLLCPMGSTKQFAQRISVLVHDRIILQNMSSAVSRMARERFSSRRAVSEYAEIFRMVLKEPAPEWSPVPWSAFRPDPNFEHSWRELIPVRIRTVVKNFIQTRSM